MEKNIYIWYRKLSQNSQNNMDDEQRNTDFFIFNICDAPRENHDMDFNDINVIKIYQHLTLITINFQLKFNDTRI